MTRRRAVAFPNEPPDLTKYAASLGLDPTTAVFSEVFSFEEELAVFVPHPVHSFLFLFPVGPKGGPLDLRHTEVVPLPSPVPWFSKQFIDDGCATMAVIHSIMNNVSKITLREGSWFSELITRTAELSPDERGEIIHDDETLAEISTATAQESTVPFAEGPCDTHFATFVECGGNLWELDGRKEPFCHGPIVRDLLLDGMGIVKRDYIPHLEGEMRISMCALTVPPAE
jgi:ubiquitin carboxyl-terminal hydrolase L3